MCITSVSIIGPAREHSECVFAAHSQAPVSHRLEARDALTDVMKSINSTDFRAAFLWASTVAYASR
jgi:hypothetical protein